MVNLFDIAMQERCLHASLVLFGIKKSAEREIQHIEPI